MTLMSRIITVLWLEVVASKDASTLVRTRRWPRKRRGWRYRSLSIPIISRSPLSFTLFENCEIRGEVEKRGRFLHFSRSFSFRFPVPLACRQNAPSLDESLRTSIFVRILMYNLILVLSLPFSPFLFLHVTTRYIYATYKYIQTGNWSVFFVEIACVHLVHRNGFPSQLARIFN